MDSLITSARPQWGAPRRRGAAPLTMTATRCCVCDSDDAAPMAVGEDFEYRTSPDYFLAMQCRRCGLVYLNPRPSNETLAQIYPPDYHAFEFSAEAFGFVYRVRRWLEARRLLAYCRGLPAQARILDVGCGDGFHLDLLRQYGQPDWQLEGVDPSPLAATAAQRRGLQVHHGTVQTADLPSASYDLAFMIATIEHVDDPVAVVRAVRSRLKPGGRLVIVTDNTATLDFALFKRRHWGGYHFPRHWNLFNPATIRALASRVEMDLESLGTLVSPVNWVYSIRNSLVDWGAPAWLINLFSLKSTLALGVFTIVDMGFQTAGRGALLRVVLRRP
ncbi:class I SAM-dependent methyltransferase [Nodosilinea nodulosa]|uniref:class I SAM-dependent methyltransferase n=1 Tax=Nodosilinea nodulosa TaxID=416001 RepID=UPI0002F2C873|nr:class I SAM-dependent methyltransferase [Nodosilinea nodulosa]